MKLKIFGKLTDIFSGSEFDLNSENINSIADLKNKLYEIFPELRESTFLIIVNGEKSDNEKLIPKDAEIALLPPYSGG